MTVRRVTVKTSRRSAFGPTPALLGQGGRTVAVHVGHHARVVRLAHTEPWGRAGRALVGRIRPVPDQCLRSKVDIARPGQCPVRDVYLAERCLVPGDAGEYPSSIEEFAQIALDDRPVGQGHTDDAV